MSTRLVSVVVDAQDPDSLAAFWAAALQWPVTYSDPDEVVVEIEDQAGHWGDAGTVPLVFVPVHEPKAVKNRVHLDLVSSSAEEQATTVERLLDLGARHIDIGQGDVPWTVLADPEGNELCVLEPRVDYAGAERIAAVVLDSTDPVADASFWQAASGWRIDHRGAGYARLRHPDRAATVLELVSAPGGKQAKDRIHVDLAPYPGDDLDSEVARLSGLGAQRTDIGQGDTSWEVLSDPGGHEFCVLTPR
ncbi:VOC family protein [Phytoactinopolyspora mesophila]|uniref:VOC family protein n=1 Tax=Phytoactinopolyspora mesophila TaxID=2650750 RepID=A0A7K3M8R7_9ACTN|nr:VOC family protein [Phytoactinopolyspora mesophila]